MAESQGNGNSITLPPSVPVFGGTKITGTAVFLAIMLFGAVAWVYKENEKRHEQFDLIYKMLNAQDKMRAEQFQRLECKIDVGDFVHSFAKGQIDWSLLPADLYSCVPNFKLK